MKKNLVLLGSSSAPCLLAVPAFTAQTRATLTRSGIFMALFSLFQSAGWPALMGRVWTWFHGNDLCSCLGIPWRRNCYPGRGAAFPLLGSPNELYCATRGCFDVVGEPSRSRSTPSLFFQESFELVTFSQETVVSKFNSLRSKWLSPAFGIDYLSIERQGSCPDMWWSGQDEIIWRLYVTAGCLHWLPCG